MSQMRYEQPKLSTFGSLSELTLTGFTNQGTDGCFQNKDGEIVEGSVIPGGSYKCPGGEEPNPS